MEWEFMGVTFLTESNEKNAVQSQDTNTDVLSAQIGQMEEDWNGCKPLDL